MRRAAIVLFVCLCAAAFAQDKQTSAPPAPLMKACTGNNPPPCASVAPKLIKDVEPQYPREARNKHLQGVVIVQGTVGTDGKLSDIEVTRPLGAGLSEAAIECVKKWRFKPAKMADGTEVPVRINIEINFRLGD